MDEINKNDELQHWGIKGMRWGVRRSQKQLDKLNNRSKAEQEAEAKKFKTSDKKHTSELSDDEIRKELNRRKLESELQRQKNQELKDELDRMDLEKKYEALNPPKGAKAKAFKEAFIKSTAEILNHTYKEVGKDVATKLGKKFLSDKLGLDVEDVESSLKKQYNIESYKTKIKNLKEYGQETKPTTNYDAELKRLDYEKRISDMAKESAARQSVRNAENRSPFSVERLDVDTSEPNRVSEEPLPLADNSNKKKKKK